jgi:hypothetical protein
MTSTNAGRLGIWSRSGRAYGGWRAHPISGCALSAGRPSVTVDSSDQHSYSSLGLPHLGRSATQGSKNAYLLLCVASRFRTVAGATAVFESQVLRLLAGQANAPARGGRSPPYQPMPVDGRRPGGTLNQVREPGEQENVIADLLARPTRSPSAPGSRRRLGSAAGLQLVVPDINDRAELVERGVEVSEVQRFPWCLLVFFEGSDRDGWTVQRFPEL